MSAVEVRELCASLQDQALFHLSLHSKELFHSNFLGWLCEAYPVAAAEALNWWVPEAETNRLNVLRERSNLDLAVQLPGRAPFIVENKVFSPPDESQLARYAEGKLAGFENPVLLLLSLTTPTWHDGTHTTPSGRTWQHLSFADLATILSCVLEALDQAPMFHLILIEEYRRLVLTLDQLATTVGRPSLDEPIEVPIVTAEALRSIRLHDAIGKLRARAAVAGARAHAEPQLPGIPIRWEAGFTNGSPLMAAFVDKGNGDWLGWQYQRGQWRVAVITEHHKGRGEELRDLREASVAARYALWFDFRAIPTLVERDISDVPPREASGGFNHYAPDFVYRYRKLPALTENELRVLSYHYLCAAAGWPDRPVGGAGLA